MNLQLYIILKVTFLRQSSSNFVRQIERSLQDVHDMFVQYKSKSKSK